MLRAMLSRRGLIATAIGGAAAWLGHVSFLASLGRRAGSMSDDRALAELCADLGYPDTIGKACLAALPATEASRASLARAILEDVRSAGAAGAPARPLAQAIRDRSREDFRDGRIVTVDGWMLSLTETRVYALAALLPQQRVDAG